MSDHRRFYVITSQGEAGPFTLEDLRNEVAAHRIDRNDRLRTAFGANLGTVGESVGPAPRNSPKSSDPRISTPEGSSTQRGAGTSRGRTSDRTLPVKARPVAPPTMAWLPLAIVGGVMAAGLGAVALWQTTPKPRPGDPSPAPALTKQESPAPGTLSPSLPAPTLSAPNYAHNHQPQAIPGTLLAWRFDQEGGGGGYHDQDRENHGRCQIRPGTGVDLSQDEDHGAIRVSYVADNEWLAFSCHVASAGRYRWSFSASHNAKIIPQPGALVWTLNGRPLGPPVTITDTGSFRQFRTFSGEVELPAGLQVLRLYAQRGGIDYGDITFTSITAGTP
jgi:hypothetical protein